MTIMEFSKITSVASARHIVGEKYRVLVDYADAPLQRDFATVNEGDEFVLLVTGHENLIFRMLCRADKKIFRSQYLLIKYELLEAVYVGTAQRD